MKGFRFYAEMPQERKSKSASKANGFPWTVKELRERAEQGDFVGYLTNNAPCVTALELDSRNRPMWNSDGTFGVVAAAIDGNHHSYGYCSASREYLSKRTVRVPEDLARILSPELFRYLES